MTYRPKACGVCGKQFQPINSKARYCAEVCRRSGRRKAHAAWRAAHSNEVRGWVKEWKEAHVGETREYGKAYRATHAVDKDKARDYNKTYYAVNREKHLQKLYGLTQRVYDDMLVAQGGRCVICRQSESARTRKGQIKRLSVDHNHTTGAVRGLLCRACNSVLGYFDEDRSRFLAAINYLDRYEPQLRVVK